MSSKSIVAIAYRVLILASIVFAITSCRQVASTIAPLPHGTVHNLNYADSGQTISVALGDTIIIKLQTIGPGGCGAPQISSSSIRFDTMLPTPTNEINPGGPILYFQFVAYAKGQATISIPYTFEDVRIIKFTVTLNVD
jgi:hypothetical protein